VVDRLAPNKIHHGRRSSGSEVKIVDDGIQSGQERMKVVSGRIQEGARAYIPFSHSGP